MVEGGPSTGVIGDVMTVYGLFSGLIELFLFPELTGVFTFFGVFDAGVLGELPGVESADISRADIPEILGPKTSSNMALTAGCGGFR